jgi:hypothetical protein
MRSSFDFNHQFLNIILNNPTLHCQSDDVHGVLAAPSFAFQHVLFTKLLQSSPVPQ